MRLVWLSLCIISSGQLFGDCPDEWEDASLAFLVQSTVQWMDKRQWPDGGGLRNSDEFHPSEKQSARGWGCLALGQYDHLV